MLNGRRRKIQSSFLGAFPNRLLSLLLTCQEIYADATKVLNFGKTPDVVDWVPLEYLSQDIQPQLFTFENKTLKGAYRCTPNKVPQSVVLFLETVCGLNACIVKLSFLTWLDIIPNRSSVPDYRWILHIVEMTHLEAIYLQLQQVLADGEDGKDTVVFNRSLPLKKYI